MRSPRTRRRRAGPGRWRWEPGRIYNPLAIACSSNRGRPWNFCRSAPRTAASSATATSSSSPWTGPRPSNALSSDMLVGLADAWAYVSDEPEVRVAVLTGANGHLLRRRRPEGHGHPVERPPGPAAGRGDPRLPLEGPAPRLRGAAHQADRLRGRGLRRGRRHRTPRRHRPARGRRVGHPRPVRGPPRLFPMGGSRDTAPPPDPLRLRHGHPAHRPRRHRRRRPCAMGLVNRVVPDGAGADGRPWRSPPRSPRAARSPSRPSSAPTARPWACPRPRP